MEHAPFEPLRDDNWPLERILANDWASEGFSATINAVFMVKDVFWTVCNTVSREAETLVVGNGYFRYEAKVPYSQIILHSHP